MSFLLHVASNPVAGLALNRGRIALYDREEETPEVMPNPDAILMELLEDNFIAAGCEDDGDDELSVRSIIVCMICIELILFGCPTGLV